MIPPHVLWRSFRVWQAWRRRGAGGSPVPLSVTYFVNGVCNLRCRGCFFFDHPPADQQHRPVELETREALALVDDVARLGVPFLELVGGEPFLRKDLLELGAHARARGLWTSVTTNGTRMTPELAREARGLFRGVFVSIDGFEDDHDRVRGPGTYRQAMQGLRMLVEAPGDAVVGVTTVIGPENVARLAELAVHVRSLGAQQYVAAPGLAPAPAPTADQARGPLAELAALRRADPRYFAQDDVYLERLLAFYESGERYGCDVDQNLHVSVSPGGEVSGCCKWPVPLGTATGGALGATLREAGPEEFAAADACPGCARHDYGATMRLFEQSLPGLVASGLRLTFGGTLSGRRRAPG